MVVRVDAWSAKDASVKEVVAPVRVRVRVRGGLGLRFGLVLGFELGLGLGPVTTTHTRTQSNPSIYAVTTPHMPSTNPPTYPHTPDLQVVSQIKKHTTRPLTIGFRAAESGSGHKYGGD